VFLQSGPSPDVATVLLEHILDVKLPIGVGVHSLMLLLAVVLISGVLLWSFRKPSLKPNLLTVALEAIVLFLRDDLVYPIMGSRRGRSWLPFFTSLFLLIAVLNFLGLVPIFKAATGNLAVTTALAMLVLILIFGVGIVRLGPGGFLKNLYPQGSPLAIGLFVALLELLGLLTKSAVLSLRLFANMFAGHLAILSFLVLMIIVHPSFAVVSLPFAVFTYLLEVLISLIQALVFTLLSCLFIQMASASHEQSSD
jgi:F-type H+-transporting ATPase subunit a